MPGGQVVEQLNQTREVEKVETKLYKNRVVCQCGNVRWVKNADPFRAKKCKLYAEGEEGEEKKEG